MAVDVHVEQGSGGGLICRDPHSPNSILVHVAPNSESVVRGILQAGLWEIASLSILAFRDLDVRPLFPPNSQMAHVASALHPYRDYNPSRQVILPANVHPDVHRWMSLNDYLAAWSCVIVFSRCLPNTDRGRLSLWLRYILPRCTRVVWSDTR